MVKICVSPLPKRLKPRKWWARVDYICMYCGEKKRDWWVEIGMVPPEDAWCDRCRSAFGKQLTAFIREKE